MRILHISDTHGQHESMKLNLKDIDLIIHSGDCSNWRNPIANTKEVTSFLEWYASLDVQYKIYVAGNHDSSIENKFVGLEDFTSRGIIYLENELVSIEGKSIYGSPISPTFGDWVFMMQRHKLSSFWNATIPDDVDILITHTPPKGILDLSYDRNNVLERCGCKSLWNRVQEVKPRLHCFGHIHNVSDLINTGTREIDGTIFSNATAVTDRKFNLGVTLNGNIIEI